MKYKTGLLSGPPPMLRFGDYLKPALPPIPDAFGHQGLIGPKDWGMLLNDTYGDCTVAGAMHCVMLWNKITGRGVHFTNLDAKEDYFTITDGADDGADMVQVAKYWQKTGFRDSLARRHKIVAYVSVDPILSHIDAAAYLFDAVGLGIKVGQKEEDEFEAGEPWLVPGPVDGLHYVPMIGKADYRKIVTWGGLQDVGEDWLESNVDQVVAMISSEALMNGKSSEGFDMTALTTDLHNLV